MMLQPRTKTIMVTITLCACGFLGGRFLGRDAPAFAQQPSQILDVAGITANWITINDSAGEPRARLHVRVADGIPELAILDKAGKARFSAFVDAKHRGTIWLDDPPRNRSVTWRGPSARKGKVDVPSVPDLSATGVPIPADTGKGVRKSDYRVVTVDEFRAAVKAIESNAEAIRGLANALED